MVVTRVGRELWRALLDLLLPPHCPGCGGSVAGSTGSRLCSPCRRGLQWRAWPGCARCGAPVGLASSCRADHSWLAGLRFGCAPFGYQGTAGELVRRLKFQGEFGAAAVLARAMSRVLAASAPVGFHRALLVPVPLHRHRRRARGFDQAALLARELAARSGLEQLQVLTRTRETLPQGDPRVLSRERNLEGAFALRSGLAVRGRRVVLVDDVVTSGATVRGCARLLKAAGAVEVGLVAACRA